MRFTEQLKIGLAETGKAIFARYYHDIDFTGDDCLQQLPQLAAVLIQTTGDFFVDLKSVVARCLSVIFKPMGLPLKVTRFSRLTG